MPKGHASCRGAGTQTIGPGQVVCVDMSLYCNTWNSYFPVNPLIDERSVYYDENGTGFFHSRRQFKEQIKSK